MAVDNAMFTLAGSRQVDSGTPITVLKQDYQGGTACDYISENWDGTTRRRTDELISVIF